MSNGFRVRKSWKLIIKLKTINTAQNGNLLTVIDALSG
jgi:hypothetical protein